MTIGIVITTINQNTAVENYDRLITDYGLEDKFRLYVIGDIDTPHLKIVNGKYYSIDEQEYRFKGNQFYDTLPFHCYTRKNLGYLLAYEDGCDSILSTDDDNFCYSARALLEQCDFTQTTDLVLSAGKGTYANYLSYFASKSMPDLWPRGIPPSEYYHCNIERVVPFKTKTGVIASVCDGSPDFDAIGHVLYPDFINFCDGKPLYHCQGYAPYNTQSTTIAREWLFCHCLPSYTGRACDIWSSYIGQHVMHEYDVGTLFIGPKLYQKRNIHTTNQDIIDEKEVILKVNILVKEILSSLHSKQDECKHDYYHRICDAVQPIMPTNFMTQIDTWLRNFA